MFSIKLLLVTFLFNSSLDNSQVIAKVSTFIPQKPIKLEVNIIIIFLLKYLHYLKKCFLTIRYIS